jgi:methylglutaconyl-CoA hydratase
VPTNAAFDRLETLAVDREGGVLRVRLNRPKVRNAFNGIVVDELFRVFTAVSDDADTRVVVLSGEGKSFSAGADLDDMRTMAAADRQDNLNDAVKLARMLQRLDTFPRPVLALVQGAVYGGAVGLCCCCDSVIATSRARFCLSEARLGLAASVISPYVVRTLGPRHARHAVLTAEVMHAETAVQRGLVHELSADLDEALEVWLTAVLAGAPEAQSVIKELVQRVHGHPVSDGLVRETALLIAELRARPEGREGLSAFFEKRPPSWAPPEE